MPAASLTQIIQSAIDNAAPKLRDISHFLWSNPELGRQEVKAHAALTDLLEDLGFHVQRHAVTPTGFIASYSNDPSETNSRPHVVFMCEYDALPEVGHACGHNLIAESAVGAGLATRAAMKEAGLAGRVTVLGTPAEESDGGKIDFIEANFFDDVDAALMVHPNGGRHNFVDPTSNCSRDERVVFEGRASHAASNPWEAINALDAAVQAYQNVANLRQHIRPGCRAAGVIKQGGDVANVIPERSEMEFTLRTPTTSEMKSLEQRWRRCIEAAATATGCSVTITVKGKPYDAMAPNQRLCEAYRVNAEAVGVPMLSGFEDSGSTDAGNVSMIVPTIHPYFHIESKAECHERDFTKDTGGETAHKLTLQQAVLLAMTGVDVLTNEKLRQEMRSEFEQWKQSEES